MPFQQLIYLPGLAGSGCAEAGSSGVLLSEEVSLIGLVVVWSDGYGRSEEAALALQTVP